MTSENRTSIDGRRPRWPDLVDSETCARPLCYTRSEGVVPMTHQQAFFLVSGIIFGLVALFHALRLAFRWQV